MGSRVVEAVGVELGYDDPAAARLRAAAEAAPRAAEAAAVECHYAPYLARQAMEAAELRREEELQLGPGLDYRFGDI